MFTQETMVPDIQIWDSAEPSLARVTHQSASEAYIVGFLDGGIDDLMSLEREIHPISMIGTLYEVQ